MPFAAHVPHARAVSEPGRLRRLLALLLLLPIFFQSFQYLIDVPLLWTFAKASPLLLAPLILLGLFRLRLPYVSLTIIMLSYMLLVTPVMSMLHLQNDLPEALGTTVKVWSFGFYFAFAFILFSLNISETLLKQAFLSLAVVNFVVLVVLWIILPIEIYESQNLGSIFLLEIERGPRIALPLAFGLIGMFWLARRFGAQPALWPVLLLLTGLTLMLMIFKQRTVIAAMLLLVLWAMSQRLRHGAPGLFWGLALGGGAMLAALLVLAEPLFGDLGVSSSLGGSLTVRQNSIEVLLDFLSENPLRWVFGFGSSTDFSQFNLQRILRTPNFFLADLGWLGVVAEYGLVGAVLVGLFYVAAWREIRRATRAAPQPMRLALHDFVVYLLISSPILPVVYTPGQVASVLAIAVYLNRLDAATRGEMPKAARRAIWAPSSTRGMNRKSLM
ncbi:hypothetical protein [Sediminicoccus sp. KRV36]|uniref:hypothetical protein n=1 Tax=Sediminicoccus sp. KRV36 TaxID=3133721 RepID=UPI00200CF139|nr:hypothetical protein [Sediminicoccus rosea]UPY35791.1 hypothetical protein LHU95_16370 [Sediminicoccus rosea]